MRPYYMLFDDRYRRVYEQGIPAWIPDPVMFTEMVNRLDRFLDTAEAVPGRTSIIEPACGEGFLAKHLLSPGYDYLGLDISSRALDKARTNTSEFAKPDSFQQGDMTNLSEIAGGSFDISIDNFGLQMLVTDPDREKYLSELNRVLKPGGWAYFHGNYNPDGVNSRIETFEEWLDMFHPDLSTPEKRQSFVDEKPVKISLPRVPARFDNEEGYWEELTQAGFEVMEFHTFSMPFPTCVIYARKEGGTDSCANCKKKGEIK